MTLGRVNHLHFAVDDLKKTEKYFIEKLGFRLVRRTEIPRTGGEHMIELASPAGDLFFHFIPATEELMSASMCKSSAERPYLDHVAFEVANLDETCKELKHKGVPIPYAPEFEPSTGRNLAGACDADGRPWIQLMEVEPE